MWWEERSAKDRPISLVLTHNANWKILVPYSMQYMFSYSFIFRKLFSEKLVLHSIECASLFLEWNATVFNNTYGRGEKCAGVIGTIESRPTDAEKKTPHHNNSNNNKNPPVLLNIYPAVTNRYCFILELLAYLNHISAYFHSTFAVTSLY